jgi:hypothetical protein
MGYPIKTEETAVFRLQNRAFEQVAVRTYPDHITLPISWNLSPHGDSPSAGSRLVRDVGLDGQPVAPMHPLPAATLPPEV